MQCHHRIFSTFTFLFVLSSSIFLFHQIVKFSPFCAVLSSTFLYVMIMNCCGVFHNNINNGTLELRMRIFHP